MQFPMMFNSVTVANSGTDQAWETRSGSFSSQVAIPPEFAGPGGALSPEDLFNHALTNCFVATFKVYAKNSKLTFQTVEARSEMTLDLGENKKPVVKKIRIQAMISGASDSEKAHLLATKAARSGFILNSVKTECEVEIQVSPLAELTT